MYSIGLILLAAGESSRLGTPKQLLPFGGKTLVRHAAETALASVCYPCIAVLGAESKAVEHELGGLPIQTIFNPDWPTGLASSLKIGLTALLTPPDSEPHSFSAVVVMLCDQPLVTAALLNTLVSTYHATHRSIVACEYNGTLGVPALFSETLFGPILTLSGDQGAKSILRQYAEVAAYVSFPDAAYDVDTQQDFEALSNNSH